MRYEPIDPISFYINLSAALRGNNSLNGVALLCDPKI